MSHIIDLVLYVGVLVTLVYLIYRYARYSRWEDTDAGRAFMGMKVCLLSLVLYAFAGLVGLEDPWRDIARILVVGGIWAALTYQVVVMVRNQGGFRRNRPVASQHTPRASLVAPPGVEGRAVAKAASPLPYQPPQLTYTYLGKYLLTSDFVVTVGGRTFTIPAGALTDLATTPRFLWNLLPPIGIYEAAAVAHDWWCSNGIANGELTSREADGFFRDMMGEAGVGRATRWAMWAAVRCAAPFSAKRRPSGFTKDAPAVLGIAALAASLGAGALYLADRLIHFVL